MGTSSSRTAPQLAIDTCGRRLRHLADVPVPAGGRPAITWHGPARFPADRAWSEATVQAVAGLMEVNGRDAGLPRRLGLEAASVAAGLLAAQGRLAAVVGGLRGRPVPEVRTSVLQAGLLLLSHYFVVATGLGDALPGPPLPSPGPPFRSADGHWFEIETLDAEPWTAFWTLLGLSGAELGRGWTVFRWRYERARCSLPPGLHEATARFPLADLRRLATRADVSLTPLRGYGAAVADPGTGPAHPTVTLRDPVQTAAAAAGRGAPVPAAVDGDLPLAGIRVVEATSRIQGPFAGMLLRMLGAEVLRIQPPEGDYGRAALCLHRGKAAVRLDLGARAGRAALTDLVADADVFLHNWRPGKAAAWGLEFDDLAARHPGLVYANTSGWGDRPEAGRLVGTDFLVQAYAGMGDGLHPEGEPAVPSRVILCDLFGGIVGAEGVLTGLYRRERTGSACEVRSSLLAGAMALQAHVLDDIAAGTEKGRRDGRPVWGLLDRPVPTAGGLLALSVDDDDSFRRLCGVCGLDPEGAPRAVSDARIAAVLGADDARRWEALLLDAGVPAAVVCDDLAAVAADPRIAELFEPVGAGGLCPRSPWTFG
jgi:crotonobetainyl-CoA:carnitine CoA-transferase CaiB-like acyl-CoA transferase